MWAPPRCRPGLEAHGSMEPARWWGEGAGWPRAGQGEARVLNQSHGEGSGPGDRFPLWACPGEGRSEPPPSLPWTCSKHSGWGGGWLQPRIPCPGHPSILSPLWPALGHNGWYFLGSEDQVAQGWLSKPPSHQCRERRQGTGSGLVVPSRCAWGNGRVQGHWGICPLRTERAPSCFQLLKS